MNLVALNKTPAFHQKKKKNARLTGQQHTNT